MAMVLEMAVAADSGRHQWTTLSDGDRRVTGVAGSGKRYAGTGQRWHTVDTGERSGDEMPDSLWFFFFQGMATIRSK